jgi:hypothetical protein
MQLSKLMFGDTNIKRKIKWFWLYTKSKMKGSDKVRLPKNMVPAEKTAYSIFMKLLLDPTSKLYYDLHTSECYIRSEDSTLYIFLEANNIKVINSVYGYDVPIGRDLEAYLTERFRREMAIRRSKFKAEALKKIEHSLETTLEKLKQKTTI